MQSEKKIKKMDSFHFYEICNKCNGKGTVGTVEIEGVTSSGYSIRKKVCNKCLGSGRLTWIEKIIGKGDDEANVGVDEIIRQIKKENFGKR